MMAVQLGGVTYELEGVLFRRLPSCSVRKAGGRPITQSELDDLSVDDRTLLMDLIQRHIEAVAFLSRHRMP